jgi:hypothetical protein
LLTSGATTTIWRYSACRFCRLPAGHVLVLAYGDASLSLEFRAEASTLKLYFLRLESGTAGAFLAAVAKSGCSGRLYSKSGTRQNANLLNVANRSGE